MRAASARTSARSKFPALQRRPGPEGACVSVRLWFQALEALALKDADPRVRCAAAWAAAAACAGQRALLGAGGGAPEAGRLPSVRQEHRGPHASLVLGRMWRVPPTRGLTSL
jgi:hypothetical protein